MIGQRDRPGRESYASQIFLFHRIEASAFKDCENIKSIQIPPFTTLGENTLEAQWITIWDKKGVSCTNLYRGQMIEDEELEGVTFKNIDGRSGLDIGRWLCRGVFPCYYRAINNL